MAGRTTASDGSVAAPSAVRPASALPTRASRHESRPTMTTQHTGSSAPVPSGQPELVVVLEPSAARGLAVASAGAPRVGEPEARATLDPLADVLGEYGAVITALFPDAFAD